jgi:MFS transporter, PAT family, beta-lactamase induction signal transducer AmpG
MKRRGWLLILVFIVVFKFGDALLGRMSGVFYRELGFSLGEIAEVMKIYGFIANGIGVLAGGVLVARIGLFRALLIAGLLAAATNLTYAWLAASGNDPLVFRIAVICGQLHRRARDGRVRRLPLEPVQCRLHGHAVRAARLRGESGPHLAVGVERLDGRCARRRLGVFFVMTAGIALLGLPLLLILMRRYPEAHVGLPASARRRTRRSLI